MFRDATFVLAVHFARYVFPIIYVPYVTRVFDPERAGQFFWAQSLGSLLGLLIEYGYFASALRSWAHASSDGKIVLYQQAVMGRATNTLMLVAGLAPVAIWNCWIGNPSAALLIGASLVLAMGLGNNTSWYFLATGRPKRGSMLEAAAQFVGLVMLVAVARVTRDPAAALLALAAGPLIAMAAGYAVAHREGFGVGSNWLLGWQGKADQLPFFILRTSALAANLGGPWLVGLAGGAVEVAKYAPLARVIGACIAVISPVSDLLIPRMVKRFAGEDVFRDPLAFVVPALFALAGLLISVAMYLLDDLVLGFLFGVPPAGVIAVFHTMLLSLPIFFAYQAASVLVFMPSGLERTSAALVALGTVVMALMTVIDPMRSSAQSAALGRLSGDAVVLAMMALVVLVSARGQLRWAR